MDDIATLEEQLNEFDPAVRREALDRLAATDAIPATEGTNVNMHLHSFFSYNALDYSPSRIAWEARKTGLCSAGLCDFDVLDGLEEFLAAGVTLGLRTTVNLETRAFLNEYADHDISSPGEPGVTYIMGAGFARVPAEGSHQAEGLAGYRARARSRNVALMDRINPKLPDIAIDYEKDVLPLTPAGAATERHMVRAYINKTKQAFPDAAGTAEFLAGLLEKPLEETIELIADLPSLEDAIRARLVKRGGIGYEQPSVDTFPTVDDFVNWVASCEAMPMTTWLDGTSTGEQNGRALLECMKDKGAVALNIIPDRNWNVSDPGARDAKRANLAAVIEAAEEMGLPINIGTEMNKRGLPFVDDLDGQVLKLYRESFLRG
ncbi:hypothetical protein ACFLQU_06260, partial [Verrucomicrobiota bacterium]